MPRLREIIGSLLHDLTWAQHQSNLHSRALSETYRNDKLLRAFPVPNAALGPVSLQLRFAVVHSENGSEEARSPGQDAVGADRVRWPTGRFLDLGYRLASLTLRALVERLTANLPVHERDELVDAILADRNRAELGDAVGYALERWSTESAPAEAGQAAAGQAVGEAWAVVERVVRRRVVGDPDIAARLDEEGRTAYIAAVREVVEPLLAALLEWIAGIPIEPADLLDLDVVVDAGTLAGLPEHALQTLDLTFEMRNYRWVVSADGRDDDLIPDR